MAKEKLNGLQFGAMLFSRMTDALEKKRFEYVEEAEPVIRAEIFEEFDVDYKSLLDLHFHAYDHNLYDLTTFEGYYSNIEEHEANVADSTDISDIECSN